MIIILNSTVFNYLSSFLPNVNPKPAKNDNTAGVINPNSAVPVFGNSSFLLSSACAATAAGVASAGVAGTSAAGVAAGV